MEYEDLVQELTCPICLCIFTDIVSLPCGHKFCRLCIIKVLITQDERADYSCPLCRRKYLKCLKLEKRKTTTMALDNIVERFLVARSDMEESRVSCTLCEGFVPAVRSCLLTKDSLCDEHLIMLMTGMGGLLKEPTISFNLNKCSTHKTIFEYYCPQRATAVCKHCLLISHVNGHDAIPLEYISEAFDKNKKNLLMFYMGELNPQKAKIQKRLQILKEHKRNIREDASNMRRSIRKLYLNIKEQQEMSEKEALIEISRQEKRVLFPICVLIKKLEIQEDKLFRKMQEMEKICHAISPFRKFEETDVIRDDIWCHKDIGIGEGQITVDSKTVFEKSDHRVASKRKAEHDKDEILVSMTLPQSVRDFVNNIKSESEVEVPDILLNVHTADKYVNLSEDLETKDQQDKV